MQATAMQDAVVRAGAQVPARMRVAAVRLRLAAVVRLQLAAAAEVVPLLRGARVVPLAAARLIATVVRCRAAWAA